MSKRLLLHVCCGPCTIGPLEALAGDDYSIDAYFYNPNIQPYREYTQRAKTMGELAQSRDLPLALAPGYDLEGWLAVAVPAQARGERCQACYAMRLGETAANAARGGYDAFSSTLLGSPYQNRVWLLAAGETAAKDHGVAFLPLDFRPFFRADQGEAKDLGLYRQGYCGCVYSEKERYEKKPRKS